MSAPKTITVTGTNIGRGPARYIEGHKDSVPTQDDIEPYWDEINAAIENLLDEPNEYSAVGYYAGWGYKPSNSGYDWVIGYGRGKLELVFDLTGIKDKVTSKNAASVKLHFTTRDGMPFVPENLRVWMDYFGVELVPAYLCYTEDPTWSSYTELGQIPYDTEVTVDLDTSILDEDSFTFYIRSKLDIDNPHPQPCPTVGVEARATVIDCYLEIEYNEANFSAEPTKGKYPLTVNFTDLSTDTPTSWLWDFGDGTTSTEQNPIHTYNTCGSFTVKLTVNYTVGSDTKTKTDYITTISRDVAGKRVLTRPRQLSAVRYLSSVRTLDVVRDPDVVRQL